MSSMFLSSVSYSHIKPLDNGITKKVTIPFLLSGTKLYSSILEQPDNKLFKVNIVKNKKFEVIGEYIIDCDNNLFINETNDNNIKFPECGKLIKLKSR